MNTTLTTDENLIFHFQVGDEHRALDPFRVERLLVQGLGGESLQAVLEQSKAPVDAIATPAMEKLLCAVQRAFVLQPVQPDGSGFTEKAQVRVLREFLTWKEAVKKNIVSSPISSPPTATSSAVPSPGKKPTDCGCSDPG